MQSAPYPLVLHTLKLKGNLSPKVRSTTLPGCMLQPLHTVMHMT